VGVLWVILAVLLVLSLLGVFSRGAW